jgi:hypothetical protein
MPVRGVLGAHVTYDLSSMPEVRHKHGRVVRVMLRRRKWRLHEWRCGYCGHRVSGSFGIAPVQTRSLALRRPWLVPVELLDRYLAQRRLRELLRGDPRWQEVE